MSDNLSETSAPWLINDYDFYYFDMNTEKGSYHYYEEMHNWPTIVESEKDWMNSNPDFYFLDLNLSPEGAGEFFFYEEWDQVKDEVFDDSFPIRDFEYQEPCSDDDLYVTSNEELDDLESDLDDCYTDYMDTWRDSCETSEEALSWSRNRQAEWYDLFRADFDLTEDDYVDEQDLLDWLGANFTITRTITQEI